MIRLPDRKFYKAKFFHNLNINHQNLEDYIDWILFNLLTETFDSVYFPSLLSKFITIFFSKSALMKPRVADTTPHTPTKMGSSF
jgi:hypothetical protein